MSEQDAEESIDLMDHKHLAGGHNKKEQSLRRRDKEKREEEKNLHAETVCQMMLERDRN